MRRIFVRTERNSETSGSVFDDFGINARRRRRSIRVGKFLVLIVSPQQRQGYTKSVEGRVVLHTLALDQVIQRSRVQ